MTRWCDDGGVQPPAARATDAGTQTTVALNAMVGRLAVVRAIVRLPAAAFPLAIAATHGASAATDAFFLVYAGVLFVSTTVSVVETTIVPFVPHPQRPDTRDRLVSAVLSGMTVPLAPLTLALLAGALVWRGAGLDTDSAWAGAWQHLLALAAVPALSAWASVLTGVLNAAARFLSAAAAAGLRGTVALAVGLSLSPIIGLAGYSVGLLCGEVVALVWVVRISGVRLSWTHRTDPPGDLGAFRSLLRSALAGALANSSRALTDRLVASILGPGAVSVLEYAQRVFLMAVSLAGAPLAIVLLSRWAATVGPRGPARAERLQAAVRRARQTPVAFGLLLLAAFWVASQIPPVQRLIALGGIDEGRVFQATLAMYFLGSVPYLLNLVTAQAILLLRDARFVTTVSATIAVLTVPLDLLGLAVLGLPGIALAFSILNLVAWLAADRRISAHVHRGRGRAGPV